MTTEPTIRAFDAEGRPLDIPRSKWADEMLPVALKQTANDPAQTANLLAFAIQQGCADRVVDAARKFARTDPDRVRGRNLFGAALASIEKLDEAETEFENLIAFAGEDPTALSNLAQVKARKGDGPAASELLKRALTADPNHAASFELMARGVRGQGGDAAFLAACRDLAKDPRAWRARLHLARARLGLGEPEAALAVYREVLKSASSSHEAMTQISGDLANAGRLQDAADLVGRVYKAEVHGPYVAANLIRIYVRLGRFDDARTISSDGRGAFGAPWAATFDGLDKEIAAARAATKGDGS
jgi:Flp pilus assembly protein TadD